MSLITDWFSVFQGPDQFRTLRNVKNPQIDAANAGLIADSTKSKAETDKAISDLSTKYSSSQPQAESRAAEESGSINDIYNGQFAKNLAAIRANRAQAMAAASDRAIGYAQRGRQNQAMLRPGGGSSYFDRLAMQQTGDITARTAIDQSDQEKQDYMAATNAQLSLAGRRNAITDAALQRLLYPAGLRAQALMQQTQELGGLTNIDNANDIYGVQKIQSTTDKIGKLTDVSFNTLVALAGAYGAGAGGMGAMGGGGAAGGDIGAAGLSGAVGPEAAAASGGGGAAAGAGGFNYGSFFSSLGKSAASGGGGGSSAIGSSGDRGWFSGFGGGRAGGGPMDANTAYEVGEKGPEIVVPAPTGASTTGPGIIAIGGLGSVQNDPFFELLGKAAPGNVQTIPLVGTGNGVAGTGVGNAKDQLRRAIQRSILEKRPNLIVGHSLGASIARELQPEFAGNPYVDFLHVDPPYGGAIHDAPLVNLLSPTAAVVNKQTDKGIEFDPNTINWSGGKATSMFGVGPEHTPWKYPNAPGNADRMSGLTNVIGQRLTGLGQRQIPGRASGGGVNPNQEYQVGEQGEELMVPGIPGSAPYMVGQNGPEVIVPQQPGFVIPNYALDEAGGMNETGSAGANPTARMDEKKPGLPSKGVIIAEILRRLGSANLQGNVGPAPTATPSGNDFSSVQGAMDRGVQLLGAQASERFHRANVLDQQAKQERSQAMAMAERIKEWNQQVQTQQENAATQKAQFAQTLAQNQAHIDAQMNRESGMDWLRQGQEATRQRENQTIQEAHMNALDYNEAQAAVNAGQITTPGELGNFKHLLPEQIQRLQGYMGSRHRQDTEQDQAVTSIVAPIVSGIRTERMALAKSQLADEEKKWKYGSNARNDSTVEHLKNAIATGEGLPLLPEAKWKTYLERLAKNPKVSQLVNIDDKTQTVTPILKNPSATSPAAPAATPGYDFGRTGDGTDIGAAPQSNYRSGSAAARALGIPMEQPASETLPPTPVRRYRYDPSTGKTVLIQ